MIGTSLRFREGVAPTVFSSGPADWRKTSKGGGAQRQQQQGEADWNARQPISRGLPVKIKRTAWLVTLVIALIAWIVYLFYNPVKTPFIAMAVTDYEAPFPPNRWAREDLDRFRDLTQEKLTDFRECQYDNLANGEESFLKLREAIGKVTKGGGPDKDVMIVYLSMHGVVNDLGESCLLPPNADACDSASWHRLADVLQYLFPKESRKELPKHILLFLDCNRITEHWQSGLFYNGFARGIESAVRLADIPGLFVLNSTGTGWECQQGHVSPETLEGSVFGYYVHEALRGMADVESSGDQNGEVSLKELKQYLQDKVSHWVSERYADVQMPEVICGAERPGSLSDVAVTHAKNAKHAPFPKVVEQDGLLWESIAKEWARIDTLAALRENPLELESARHFLLRWEALSQAGEAYTEQAGDMRKRAASRISELGQAPLSTRIPAHTLPSLAGRFPAGQLELQQAAIRDAWDEEKREFALKDKTSISDAAVAKYAFQRCHDSLSCVRPNTPEDEWPAIEALFPNGHAPPIIECHFLTMLRRHLPASVWERDRARIAEAIETRQMAEQAALPRDVRAHYWSRPLVERGDQKRRLAEDVLMVGRASLPNFPDGAMGEREYAEAQVRADKISQAYGLRDEIWSSLPYLGEWLFSRSRPGMAGKHADDFYDLIAATSQLSEQLDNHERLADEPLAELPTETDFNKARDLFERLREAYDADFRKVESKSNLPLAAALLAIPPLSAKSIHDRQRMRWDYESVIRHGRDSDFSPGGDEGSSAAPTDTEAALLDTFAAHEYHPALAILRAGADTDAELESPARGKIVFDAEIRDTQDFEVRQKAIYKRLCLQGELARQLLKNAQHDAEQELPNEIDPNRAMSLYRPAVCRSERIMRISAPLLQLDPLPWGESLKNPVKLLHAIDTRAMLLCQAKRTLDDFWHGYFDSAAEDYLRSAEEVLPRELLPSGVRTTEGELAQLRALRDLRIAASRDGIRLDIGDIDVNPKAAEASSPIAVKAVHLSDGLPEGQFANTVLAPDRDETEVLCTVEDAPRACPRFPLPIPAETVDPPAVSVANDALMKSSGYWSVRSLYRGHVFHTGTFGVSQIGAGLIVKHKPPVYGPPSIQVSGDASESSTIVFVLDCSRSMQEKLGAVREAGNAEDGRSRMDAAKEILQMMLEDLAKYKGKFNVGLFAYGSRTGFDPSDKTGKTKQTWDYELGELRDWDPSRKGTDPKPEDDARWIWKITRFDERTCAEKLKKLQELEPVGATPLYYSITEVLDDLENDPPAGKSHVVVITDGVDWRFGLDDSAGYTQDLDTASKVLRDSKETVRLDVIAFDAEDHDRFFRDDAERKKYMPIVRMRYEHLKGLPESTTRGQFFTPQDTAALLDNLRSSLRLRRFRVEDVQTGRYASKEPLRLNETLTLEWDRAPGSRVRSEYQIDVPETDPRAETKVWLEGGEAIQLHLSDDLMRLEHRRYATNVGEHNWRMCDAPQGLPGPSGFEVPREFYVASHASEWIPGEDAVKFWFSIQNGDETKFSPRPAEAWIEIQAMRDGVADPDKLYHFYDLTFEEDRPVPVIVCNAYGWPEGADASVRMWFKLTSTEAARRGTVGELRNEGSFSVPGIDGVEFTVDTERVANKVHVVVVETHEQGELNAAKVEMNGTPLEIIREFNRKIGRVEHRFVFPAGRQVDGYVVLFTSAKELFAKGKCVSFPEGDSLTVGVPPR